ncbi:transcription antiterminator BglG [Companilactobacillus crustorum]|uniref:Transcription antiterminator n=3 Tax=Companilactobacillus TaxID=2767879 RepID=A0A837RFF3_9LACO|nr:PRD domain-containing protein [Companilactobacillus crustorum]APU72319.1 Transcription antiterminator LicT [Companilactobacillus crustorum]KRK41666.1 transcription antiterminator [Companilactobacillus crustorum JCM 15951]KRO19513.1 transcription antiterminator [Companilactobacillus crustorum]WDT65631.1 PRD domain-containing protein [Companilactobacillus crustorum]GEO77157.1 transcription antiterminator BglG [Companilactobacillus crustorum]
MKIKRALNNNAAIATNHDGVDVLVMGPGVTFGKKTGDLIDIAKVEKTLFLKNKEAMNKFTDLVIDVPMDQIEISERIINLAKMKLGKKLNEIVYVNLTDHIHMAVKRAKDGILLSNPLKWDVARFYADEFAVGQKAVEVINDSQSVNLSDDEAAFIAIHFINAESENGAEQNQAYEITKIIKACENIVKDYFHTEFDEQSLNYYRFITHLKFFAQRVLQGKHYDDEDDTDLLETLEHRYAKPYSCSKQIKQYISENYDFTITSSELLYLTVHISRLVKNL